MNELESLRCSAKKVEDLLVAIWGERFGALPMGMCNRISAALVDAGRLGNAQPAAVVDLPDEAPPGKPVDAAVVLQEKIAALDRTRAERAVSSAQLDMTVARRVEECNNLREQLAAGKAQVEEAACRQASWDAEVRHYNDLADGLHKLLAVANVKLGRVEDELTVTKELLASSTALAALRRDEIVKLEATVKRLGFDLGEARTQKGK